MRWPQAPAQTLLVVDDDAFMRDMLADFLGQEGYTILFAQNAAEGIELLMRHDVQVIIGDQCMPSMSGTAFFERARQLCPACYRIMLSALVRLRADHPRPCARRHRPLLHQAVGRRPFARQPARGISRAGAAPAAAGG